MRRNISRRCAPKLVAAVAAISAVCGLVSGPALALELGDIQVESSLGQPLRASVAFTLNPNEQMFDFCVGLRPGVAGGPIQSVTRANVAVVGNRLVFTGDTVIKDPLLNMQVVVDCPYTPQLSRQYTLVIDPAEFFQRDAAVAAAPAPAAVAPVARSVQRAAVGSETAPAAQNSQRPAVTGENTSLVATTNQRLPIELNSEYRVQSGDSVSSIAARIEGRTSSLQNAIAILVASNPDAFVNGDAGRLLAGSLLSIPAMIDENDMDGEVVAQPSAELQDYLPEPVQREADPVASAMPPAPVEEPVAEVGEVAPPADDVSQPPGIDMSAAIDQAASEPIEVPAAAEAVAEPAAVPAATETSRPRVELPPDPAASELQPGDIVVPPMTESTAAVSTAPQVAPQVVGTANTTASDPNWWSWLTLPLGGAVLLIGAILLLGRQVRHKFGSVAVGEPDQAAPAPQALADDTQESVAIAQPAATPEPAPQIDAVEPAVESVDFQFDDTISADAISLDADLDAGTGLRDADEMDVAQDFGFAASGQVEIDHEIPAQAALEPEDSNTDIIPPAHREVEPSILEAEVTPDDEYDLSMIVDATKQHIDDTQLTVQDLQAVPLEFEQSDSYSYSDDTLASDADLQALEQDYQEEFTQTQALSQEIEEAARELAAKLDNDIGDDDPTGDEPILTIEDPGLDPTAEMLARHPEDELTAEMPARTIENEVTMELPEQSSATEVTARLAVNIDAENDDDGDNEVTTKLVAAGNEPTVEMQIETVIADLDKDD